MQRQRQHQYNQEWEINKGKQLLTLAPLIYIYNYMYKMTVSFFKVMMHGGKISTEEIINKNLLTCIQDSNLTGPSTVNNSDQYR